jgi:23S rRNA (cytosine1962-C5)-methyltransferase
MLLLTPTHWKDYELLDCGNFEKLERFGSHITIRPEPQALWDKKWSDADWKKKAHVLFKQKTSSSGDWQKLKQVQEQWKISYGLNSEIRNSNSLTTEGSKFEISLRLGLTSFKHVGVFPEQAVNWDYIFNAVHQLKSKGIETPRFLNLFAYTGGASLVAKAAGADVVHVDSIKQVVSWARENMDHSHLTDIRWVVEDALKFVSREAKRGNRYHGIILDPPAFGHGPNGEKWKLEDNINEMMKGVISILDPENHFLILNAYSLGFSSLIIENMLSGFAKENLETGELFLKAQSGIILPLGVFGRFRNF